jgi:hypothetical protein
MIDIARSGGSLRKFYSTGTLNSPIYTLLPMPCLGWTPSHVLLLLLLLLACLLLQVGLLWLLQLLSLLPLVCHCK